MRPGMSQDAEMLERVLEVEGSIPAASTPPDDPSGCVQSRWDPFPSGSSRFQTPLPDPP